MPELPKGAVLVPDGAPDAANAGEAPHAMRPAASIYLALASVQILFGSLSVAAKGALGWMPAPTLVMSRVAGATLVMHVVAAFAGRERIRSWRDHLRLAGLALCGVVLNQGLFITGLTHTTAVNATVLGSTTSPVFTAAIAILWGRERFDPLRALGIAVAACGALYLLHADRVALGAGTLVGDLMVVGNSLSFASFLVLSRGILRRYRATTVVLWTFTYANLVVIPWGAAGLVHTIASRPPLLLWALVAYLVAGPTLGSYHLNAFALKRAPASLVATFIYAQPIVAAALAIAFLGEHLAARQVIGAVIVLVGLRLSTVRAARA